MGGEALGQGFTGSIEALRDGERPSGRDRSQVCVWISFQVSVGVRHGSEGKELKVLSVSCWGSLGYWADRGKAHRWRGCCTGVMHC